MWSISLEVMLVDLLSMHQVDEGFAIDAAFGMTICCHVSSVAPPHVMENSFSQIFSDPHYMSK